MFRRINSNLRIELIKQEKERIEKLLANKKYNQTDLKNYLNFLETQLKVYPCLKLLEKHTNNG
jgi:hypothetical protein